MTHEKSFEKRAFRLRHETLQYAFDPENRIIQWGIEIIEKQAQHNTNIYGLDVGNTDSRNL